jgi:hypothetical protein
MTKVLNILMKVENFWIKGRRETGNRSSLVAKHLSS